jgi:hypothetical protein
MSVHWWHQNLFYFCADFSNTTDFCTDPESHIIHYLARQCIEKIVACGGIFEETFFAHNDRLRNVFKKPSIFSPSLSMVILFQAKNCTALSVLRGRSEVKRFWSMVRTQFVQYLKPILRHGWLTIRCDLLRAFRGAVGEGGAAVAVHLQATARAHHADSALHISKFIDSGPCSNK